MLTNEETFPDPMLGVYKVAVLLTRLVVNTMEAVEVIDCVKATEPFELEGSDRASEAKAVVVAASLGGGDVVTIMPKFVI